MKTIRIYLNIIISSFLLFCAVFTTNTTYANEVKIEATQVEKTKGATLKKTESFADTSIKQTTNYIRKINTKVANSIGIVCPSLEKLLLFKVVGVPIIALISTFFTLLFSFIIQKRIVQFFSKLSAILLPYQGEQIANKVITSVSLPVRIFIVSFAVAVSIQLCVTNTGILFLLGKLLWAFVLGMLIWVSCIIADFIFDLLFIKLSERSDIARNIHFIAKKVFNVIYLILSLIVVLDIYGFNVSAIVASLGIGGAAIAFASQSTVSNFFGSFSIAAENPFVKGDWVKIGDNIEGFIREIGVRSTKIETVDNTTLTVPNSMISESYIDNLSRCEWRGDNISFVLTHNISKEQIRTIIQKIKDLLNDTPGVSREEQIVVFDSFATNGIEFLIEYNTFETDREGYFEMRNVINTEIFDIIKGCGCEFAKGVQLNSQND